MEYTSLALINPRQDESVIALHNEANKLLDYANARTITTLEDAKSATNDLSLISKLRKAMETKRKDYLLPFQEHVKEVNGIYQTLTAPIEQADKVTRAKWTAFTNEQARLKAEQERINNLRMEAAKAEAALNNGEIKESVNLVEVVEAPKRTITDMGSAGQRDNWTYEVVDFNLLPNEYKLPNNSLLNSLAKSVKNTRTIPGLRIYNDPTMVVRSR